MELAVKVVKCSQRYCRNGAHWDGVECAVAAESGGFETGSGRRRSGKGGRCVASMSATKCSGRVGGVGCRRSAVVVVVVVWWWVVGVVVGSDRRKQSSVAMGAQSVERV